MLVVCTHNLFVLPRIFFIEMDVFVLGCSKLLEDLYSSQTSSYCVNLWICVSIDNQKPTVFIFGIYHSPEVLCKTRNNQCLCSWYPYTCDFGLRFGLRFNKQTYLCYINCFLNSALLLQVKVYIYYQIEWHGWYYSYYRSNCA